MLNAALLLKDFLTNIANSIREKTGFVGIIAAKDIPNEIERIKEARILSLNDKTISSVSDETITIVGASVFDYCENLSNINLPNCTKVANEAFHGCNGLTFVELPSCETIETAGFAECHNLTRMSFPKCTEIGDGAFAYCIKLSEIYLMSPTMCSLGSRHYIYGDVFEATKITSSTGSIYVPASLVTAYKQDPRWSAFSNRIVGIND